MSEPGSANSVDPTADNVQARRQDPRVEKVRPDPAQPAASGRTLRGLWGDSDRPGFRRLYFSTSLDSYAEFRVEDVIEAVDVPPEQPPFFGERATRVTLPPDAPVDITHTRPAGTIDHFDIDVRFGYPAVSAMAPNVSVLEPCLLGATPGDVTCDTSQTCGTCFGQLTCEGTCMDCPTDGCPSQVEPCRQG
jgi:hypothetical protein